MHVFVYAHACVCGVYMGQRLLFIFCFIFFTCESLGSHNTGHEDKLFSRMTHPVVWWIISIIAEGLCMKMVAIDHQIDGTFLPDSML